MNVTLKHGGLRPLPADTVILHHTGGMSLSGAVSTLKARGLSYHYIIERDGKVHNFVDPRFIAFHAIRHNHYSVGISFVGGGNEPQHAVSFAQAEACRALLADLVRRMPSLRFICGHRHRTISGKWDPQLPGERPGIPDRKIEEIFYENLHPNLTFKPEK